MYSKALEKLLFKGKKSKRNPGVTPAASTTILPPNVLSASTPVNPSITATAPSPTSLPAPVTSSSDPSMPATALALSRPYSSILQNSFRFQSSIGDEKWTVFSSALLVVNHEQLSGLLSSLKDVVDGVCSPNNLEDIQAADLVRGLAKELIIATLKDVKLKADAFVRVKRSVNLLKDAISCRPDSRSSEQQATISMLPIVLSGWKKDLGLEDSFSPPPELKRTAWKVFDSIIETSIAVSDPLGTVADLTPVPYLKTINGAVLYLLKLAEETRSNYEGVRKLASTARAFLLLIFDNYKPNSKAFYQAVIQFSHSLKEIQTTCQEIATKPFYDRVFKAVIGSRRADFLIRKSMRENRHQTVEREFWSDYYII